MNWTKSFTPEQRRAGLALLTSLVAEAEELHTLTVNRAYHNRTAADCAAANNAAAVYEHLAVRRRELRSAVERDQSELPAPVR